MTHFTPTSATVSMVWFSEWLRSIESIEKSFKEGAAFKENVVFVQRSPLSLWVHDITRMQPPNHTNTWLRLMDELKSRFSTAVILCQSEEIKSQQRVAERSFWAEDEIKRIRNALHEGDSEIQNLYNSKYSELQEHGWIDATIKTTSVKQGQAELVALYGLDKWNTPIDLSDSSIKKP